MASLPHEQASAILIRVLEALARQNGKTLSARTRADVARACELLGSGGADELEDLLDDLPAPPRVSPAEAAIGVADPGFQAWRARRYEEG